MTVRSSTNRQDLPKGSERSVRGLHSAHRQVGMPAGTCDGRTAAQITITIKKQAEDMFFRLVKQMAEREGVTEKLKADNQMEWVGRMNNIRSRATEIVNAELIFA